MSGLTVPGHPFQYAWVVPDLAAGIRYWSEVLGVGPFYTNEVDSRELRRFRYRGGAGELRMRVAWAQGREGQIELLQVLSSAPNVYHELVPPGRTGFHHVGIWTDDYAHDLAVIGEAGYRPAMELEAGGKVCYVDTSAANGSMLEVIERGPRILGLFELIRQAAEAWDGERPMRSLDELLGDTRGA